MVVYGDDLVQFYNWLRHYVWAMQQKSLDYLLWSPWGFLGHPYLFNLEYGALYPFVFLSLILGVGNYITFVYLFSVLACVLGMRLYVQKILLLPSSSAWLAGLVWGFNGFVFPRIWAGHFNVVATYPWLPWELFFLSRLIDTGKFRYGVGWLVSMYFQLTAGFVSLFMFSVVVQIIWFVYWSRGKYMSLLSYWRIWLGLLFFFVCIFVPIILSFNEILQGSARSEQKTFTFSSSYSLPITHIVTGVFPDYWGNPLFSNSIYAWNYIGTFNYWELSFFIGVSTFILALVSVLLFFSQSPVRFYWVVCIISFVLALGDNTPFFYYWFSAIPLYRFIRIPAQHLYLVVFCIAILAAYGSSHLYNLSVRVRTIIVAFFVFFTATSIFLLLITRLYAFAAHHAHAVWASDFGDAYVREHTSIEGIQDPVVTQQRQLDLLHQVGWKRINTGLVSDPTQKSELVFAVENNTFSLNMLILSLQFSHADQSMIVDYSLDGTEWFVVDSIDRNTIRKVADQSLIGDVVLSRWRNVKYIRFTVNDTAGSVVIDRMHLLQW